MNKIKNYYSSLSKTKKVLLICNILTLIISIIALISNIHTYQKLKHKEIIVSSDVHYEQAIPLEIDNINSEE